MATAIPQHMRAAIIHNVGPVENIEIAMVPVPQPTDNEVLIKADAMAVNHVDLFIRSGAYVTPMPSPFIIGRDVVGHVAAVGDAVQAFSVNDRVWCNSLGYDHRQGSFSQFSVANQERVYPLSSDQAATEVVSVLHTMATAHLGLCRETSAGPGDTVFIAGAAGGVGSAAVQLAAKQGARVIASAAPRDHDWVTECGADTVFDYHDPALASRISQTAADGIDVYWDTSGHHDLANCLELLSQGGSIIIAAGLDREARLPVKSLYTRDASLRGFAMTNAAIGDLSAAARTINSLLSTSGIRTRLGACLPLSQARYAHQLQDPSTSESVSGRIVIVPD